MLHQRSRVPSCARLAITRATGASTIALLAVACARQPAPCLGARSCSAGLECLAARCSLEGDVPVDPHSSRRVLTPTKLWVGSPRLQGSVPATLTFGGTPAAVLYLEFERLAARGEIDAAFLILEPVTASNAGGDVQLEVRRAEAWSGQARFTPSQRPRLSPPVARGMARAHPPLPARIDVTRLMRFLSANPQLAPTLVVRAETGSSSFSVSTGAGSGSAPRLDVYLRRAELK